jgi:hypothetical protein
LPLPDPFLPNLTPHLPARNRRRRGGDRRKPEVTHTEDAVTADPRRHRWEHLRQENCGLAARTSCCPSFFPSTTSVHLARDVFDRMTYLSTSPLVSLLTKPTPIYPPMHACVAGLCAVHASIFFQNTSDHGGHAFCCSRDMPTNYSMLCLLEPLRSLWPKPSIVALLMLPTVLPRPLLLAA